MKHGLNTDFFTAGKDPCFIRVQSVAKILIRVIRLIRGSVRANQIGWEYVNQWCVLQGTQSLLDEIRASIPPL